MKHEPLDLRALTELQALMGSDFGTLVQTFLADSEQRIEAVAAALERGDADGIRRAAHSFKGSSGNMGALRLSELCREMEERGRSEQLEDAPVLLSSLRVEFEAVKEALASLN